MAVHVPTYTRKYSFEKYRPVQATRLDTRKSESDAQALLERLGQPVPPGGFQAHPLFPALQDYCMDVTVNIDWYEEQRQRTRRDWKRLFYGIIAAGGVTSSVAIGLAYWLKTEAAITLFLAAFLPAIQGMASATDHKARLGGFWKASADLKELLFRLEEAWRGKALEQDRVTYHVDGRDVERTFEEVLKLDRTTARQIARAERENFFNTFKSPTEAVSRFSESIATMGKPAKPADPKTQEAERAKQAQPPPEAATRLKSTAEELSRLIQDIKDPGKRTEVLGAALKIIQVLSKAP
jgi:hypothetical protein